MPESITQRQMSYIGSLLAERPAFNLGYNPDRLTKEQASRLITRLLGTPRSAAPAQPTVQVGVGNYIVDGTIYRVRKSRTSGALYGMRFVPEVCDFEYEARRPLALLRPEHEMTQEQARDFGLLYGQCVNCDRALSKEESVHVGYGPTCAKNKGWYYPTAHQMREILAGAEYDRTEVGVVTGDSLHLVGA